MLSMLTKTSGLHAQGTVWQNFGSGKRTLAKDSNISWNGNVLMFQGQNGFKAYFIKVSLIKIYEGRETSIYYDS